MGVPSRWPCYMSALSWALLASWSVKFSKFILYPSCTPMKSTISLKSLVPLSGEWLSESKELGDTCLWLLWHLCFLIISVQNLGNIWMYIRIHTKIHKQKYVYTNTHELWNIKKPHMKNPKCLNVHQYLYFSLSFLIFYFETGSHWPKPALNLWSLCLNLLNS